ncbi:MAG: Uma2 family endonuclease [Microcystaceae cyanobacterium]
MTSLTVLEPVAVTLTPNLLILPGQDQLPCDDGEPMETQRHKWQMDLLIDGLTTWLESRDNGYVNGNMFIYFSQAQIKNQDFRGPDFFAVTGVSKKERKSWVVWEEEKAPDVVIELLSESTLQEDKTTKKQIYQDKMRVSEYFWYDPFAPDDFAGFALKQGLYEPISFNEKGWLDSQCLELTLVRWSGDYRGIEATWLRWASQDGTLFPTAQELAKEAQELAKKAEQRADLAEQRAELLAETLRKLGIDPDAS